MSRPVFSIIMCSKNSELTLQTAINSVLMQHFQDWELIILDNGSTDQSWNIIQKNMNTDNRIKGLCYEKNVGWAKGASICLNIAEGQYMTFLAADDFLYGNDCFDTLNEHILQKDPDIIWIGYNIAKINNGKYIAMEVQGPAYHYYHGDCDKTTEIYELMSNTYYNSFFHYEKIDFLRKNNINFFYPYYADYEGMTEALCDAERMVIIDKNLYTLVMNTSQTRGVSSWRDNIVPWQSVLRAIEQKGLYNKEKIAYIAARIINNNIGVISSICTGSKVRDDEMNMITKNPIERFQKLEHVLETSEWNLMLYFSQNYQNIDPLIEAAKNAYNMCLLNGDSVNKIHDELHWLHYYVECLYSWDGNDLIKRDNYDLQCYNQFKKAISNENNKYSFGFELINGMLQHIDRESESICHEILCEYAKGQCRIIEELLQIAHEIRKIRKTNEIEIISNECMEIVSSIQMYLSDEQLTIVNQKIAAIKA